MTGYNPSLTLGVAILVQLQGKNKPLALLLYPKFNAKLSHDPVNAWKFLTTEYLSRRSRNQRGIFNFNEKRRFHPEML